MNNLDKIIAILEKYNFSDENLRKAIAEEILDGFSVKENKPNRTTSYGENVEISDKPF